MDSYSMDSFSTTPCGLQTLFLNSVLARLVTHRQSRCMALAGSDSALADH
jgi:hypothetical protein